MADDWGSASRHVWTRARGSHSIEEVCLDVEVSNRCNADCEFCPRDRTPHQGSMTPDVFARTLERAVELREVLRTSLGITVNLSFCGLGEGILNRHLPGFVRAASTAGFEPRLCSNGSLVTPERARALVDAGLTALYINCGELDEEYEKVYKVPFAPVRDNVVRFMEIAGDRCVVYIVLVDHRDDPARVARVRSYWKSLGVRRFYPSPMLNRAGTIDVPGMDFADHPEQAWARVRFREIGVEPLCAAPFSYPFVGYDGQYYLCSSDWEKRTAMGSVFEHSYLSVMEQKLEMVSTRSPICAGCCHDPVNALAATLGEPDSRRSPDPEELRALHASRTASVHRLVEMSRDLGLVERDAGRRRRTIPVRAS